MFIPWLRRAMAQRLWPRQPVRRRPRGAGLTRVGAARVVEVASEETPEERPSGCGWFDSSHELRAGLIVQEHASAEGLAQALPAGVWLEWHLRQGASPSRA